MPMILHKHFPSIIDLVIFYMFPHASWDGHTCLMQTLVEKSLFTIAMDNTYSIRIGNIILLVLEETLCGAMAIYALKCQDCSEKIMTCKSL